MPMDMTRAELSQAIDELNAAYAEAIDDELERWPDFFTEDCEYRIIPRENLDAGLPACLIFCDSRGALEDRVVALRKANIYPEHYTRHLIGRPHIESIEQAQIRARSNFAVLQTRKGGDASVYAAGKYLDLIVHDGGGLKLKSRSCVLDSGRVRTLLVTPI